VPVIDKEKKREKEAMDFTPCYFSANYFILYFLLRELLAFDSYYINNDSSIPFIGKEKRRKKYTTRDSVVSFDRNFLENQLPEVNPQAALK